MGERKKGQALWNSDKFNTVHDTQTQSRIDRRKFQAFGFVHDLTIRSRYISLLAWNIFRDKFQVLQAIQQRQLNYASKHISLRQSSYFQHYLPEIITFVMNFLPSRNGTILVSACFSRPSNTYTCLSNIVIISLTQQEFSRTLCSLLSAKRSSCSMVWFHTN